MHSSKLTLRLFLAIFLGVGLAFILSAKKQNLETKNVSAVFDSISPVPDQVEHRSLTERMDSPDGTKTLIMRLEIEQDRVKYDYSVSDLSGDNEVRVYSEVLNQDSGFEAPFNTWSPDNKYFFLKKTGPGINNYLVFKASGESFDDERKYLQVTEFFQEKFPEYDILEATGWASNRNLLINAKLKEGEESSFWFNAGNQNLTHLSTYFR